MDAEEIKDSLKREEHSPAIEAARQKFWREALLAVAPAAYRVEGWTFRGKPLSCGKDRADAAVFWACDLLERADKANAFSLVEHES